jgi:hypothetical protein
MTQSSLELSANGRTTDQPAASKSCDLAVKSDAKTEPVKSTPSYSIPKEVWSYLLSQCSLIVPGKDLTTFDGAMKAAIRMFEELKPQSITEGMLVAQMFAVHERAMRSLRDSGSADLAMKSAMGLLKLYLEQLGAQQRIRGKGVDQRVTVEHVHIHDGARAVVGNVSGDRISEADQCRAK